MGFSQTSPYGSWKSPITADLVAGGEVGLEQVRIDGDDIYWIERRAEEGGRKVIVRRSSDGAVADVTPVGFNARTRVHEYGGADYAVSNGTIISANFVDQRLYLQKLGAQPKPIMPSGAFRYADGEIDRRRNLFFCVREDHSAQSEVGNTIVCIDLNRDDAGKVIDRKSTRLNSSHGYTSYAVFCLKKKTEHPPLLARLNRVAHNHVPHRSSDGRQWLIPPLARPVLRRAHQRVPVVAVRALHLPPVL